MDTPTVRERALIAALPKTVFTASPPAAMFRRQTPGYILVGRLFKVCRTADGINREKFDRLQPAWEAVFVRHYPKAAESLDY